MTSAEDDDLEAIFRNKHATKDVRRKVVAEKKAYDLVKQLIEEDVDQDFFVKSVYFLSEQHYQDIIEERSILQLCGYPLCDKTLKNVPKQQFRISKNRVYDLTQRKFFCSDRCYKASEHVKKQIPTAPLWLRDQKKVHLIDLDSSGVGAKGEEVILQSRVPYTSDEREGTIDIDDDQAFDELTDSHATSSVSTPSKTFIKEAINTKTTKHSVSSKSTPKPTKSVLESMLDILREWITEKTLEHVGLIAKETPVEKESSSDELRKMKKLKLLEAKLDQVVRGGSKTTPINDPKVVEQEAADIYAGRVELFYRGRLSQNEGVRFKDVEEKEDKAPRPTVVQPRVDSKDQRLIRRNILHQKLEKVCKDLFPRLPLAVTASDLKSLISTFNLTSTNVVLKTNEYPLMAIIVMHIMSRCNDDVIKSFDQSRTLICHVLTAYDVELTSLQRTVDDVIEKMNAKKL